MRVTTSKSKHSESFYITKSYTNAQGKSTSTTIRKLGTLAEFSRRLGTDRDGVMAWAKKQAKVLCRGLSFSSVRLLWPQDGFHMQKNPEPLQISV